MTLTRQDPPVERMERVQPLQAGQYWRARSDIEEQGIDAGTVLLIESIRWVDDAPHTIILRPHPDKHGKSFSVVRKNADGSESRRWLDYREHRFLLDDFLSDFEPEPDYRRIRDAEIAAVRGQITALQDELTEAQSNPAILSAVVAEGLREADEKAAKEREPGLPVPVRVSSAELADVATGSLANAMAHAITPQTVEAIRDAAQREHQIATITAKWISERSSGIAATVAALTPYYTEQAAAALAATEDVRTYVAKLLRGIETLDLYVGKDVEVETLRKGASAPKNVPLSFVQRKLMMDEELAVFLDLDEWFDFTKTELFDKALLEHDGLVSQIFPTDRCVLVMATTRREIDYGHPWVSATKNQQNKAVFLLVRDGDNIHRVWSPVESHLGSARLFPTQDENNKYFRGFDGSEIKLDDVAYTDRLSVHRVFVLHYKRFLVLACGLDHRLKLFGDFYEGPPSFDFVSLGFQERSCRFIHDDDDGAGLLPGEHRPSLSEWLAEKNAYLRSGSRVLCNWSSIMTPSTAPSACFSYGGRGEFDRRYSPRDETGMAIAFRDGDAICVSVEVHGHSYSAGGDRSFNAKVTLSRSSRGSERAGPEQPYLVLDAVTADEIHWYIHHRDTRRDHISYIRFFKRALRHVEAELAAEADTRGRMVQALADGRVATGEDATALVQQAVIAWRAAHRGRTLPRFDGASAPAAWKSLLDQMFMLAGDAERRTPEIETFARDLGYEPLRLVLSGGARLVVYAAPLEAERDDRFEPHAWVHRITVERGKTKVIEKARRWAILPKHAVSETLIHEWDGAAMWSALPTAFDSFAHKARAFDELDGSAGALRPFAAPLSRDAFDSQLRLCVAERDAASGQYVATVEFVRPFGLVKGPRRGGEPRVLAIAHHNAFALLAAAAPDDEARKAARAAFIRAYRNKAAASEGFATVGDHGWRLVELPLSELGAAPYRDSASRVLDGQQHGDPRLARWFGNWRSTLKNDDAAWIAPDALGADGVLVFDDVLGIELPGDFEPLVVLDITVHRPEHGPAFRFQRFLDLMPAADHDAPRGGWATYDLKRHTAGIDATGFGVRTHRFPSRALALEFIAGRGGSNGRATAVPAADLADAPSPPDGVERWYFDLPDS